MKLYENEIDYLTEKFITCCDCTWGVDEETQLKTNVINCYRNRLKYNCGYIAEIENLIDEILKVEDEILWWLDLLD